MFSRFGLKMNDPRLFNFLKKVRTSFTVGGISRRYFGTNSSGADEESESKTAGDGGVIVFMRLLSFTHDLNRFGE